MRLALATVVASLAVAPAAAGAATPVRPPTIKLVVEGAGGDVSPIAARGERFRVRGVVRPYVPGQEVVVRIHRGGRKLKAVRLAVTRPKGAREGRFVTGYAPGRAGVLRIRASHAATPEMATAVARERSVRVVVPRATPGARGPAVRLLQRLLADRGYVVGERGVYDARTARAVLAFRKLSGLERTEQATATVFRRLLAGGGAFKVRFPRHGRHVEADLTRQVMALIDRGEVRRIYPISSGAPATPTVLGSYRVYYKAPGTNAKGMVHSSYFIRGYAIHGYAEVPVFPASHGCLRTPVPDAQAIYDWVRMGDRVDVYYRPSARA